MCEMKIKKKCLLNFKSCLNSSLNNYLAFIILQVYSHKIKIKNIIISFTSEYFKILYNSTTFLSII